MSVARSEVDELARWEDEGGALWRESPTTR